MSDNYNPSSATQKVLCLKTSMPSNSTTSTNSPLTLRSPDGDL